MDDFDFDPEFISLFCGFNKLEYEDDGVLVKELEDSGTIVMPGGGITEENLEEIQMRTRCVEFHASARAEKASEMEFTNKTCSLGSNGQEYSTMVTSRDKVSNLIKIYKVTFFK